jgi:hypothetical protein
LFKERGRAPRKRRKRIADRRDIERRIKSVERERERGK